MIVWKKLAFLYLSFFFDAAVLIDAADFGDAGVFKGL